MTEVYDALNKLDIAFEEHEHPAVFTCEEAEQYYKNIDAAHVKNLFLRNRKGSAHYLVIAEQDTKVDLKKLGNVLEESKLSFASPERLMKYLQLEPGSVSAFGLVYETAKDVHVVVDENLFSSEKIGFHPNRNTATIVLSTTDFKKYLESTGNTIRYISF